MYIYNNIQVIYSCFLDWALVNCCFQKTPFHLSSWTYFHVAVYHTTLYMFLLYYSEDILHEIYPPDKYLGAECANVNCSHHAVQWISRIYSPIITETLYPLTSTSTSPPYNPLIVVMPSLSFLILVIHVLSVYIFFSPTQSA